MGEGCIPPDAIDALLAGTLSDARRAQIEAHLEDCRDCRVLVGELAKDPAYDAPAGASVASSETLRPGDPSALTVAEDEPGRSRPSLRRLRPHIIDRYVVDRRLGAGGMGVVFLADDPDLHRKVVIKLLRPQASQPAGAPLPDRTRLLREAQAMAQVSHPNVVPIYDVGVHDDQVFLAMEFIDGRDLAAWLIQPRGVREVLEVFVAAGRGLAAAHRAGLVHRDFKPHNVMVANTGEVKVTDFGLARADADASAGPTAAPPAASCAASRAASPLLETPLTHAGTIVGTPAYMAPEQLAGEAVDARSDQFGFCVALYEALYGERPFPGASMSQLYRGVLAGLDERRTPPRARGGRIPARVRAALRRGLSADPAARFPSIDALLAELAPRSSRRRLAFAALAAASVATAAVASFAALDHRDGAASTEALCSGGAAELAAIWNPERRRAIEAAFTAVDPGVAPNAFAVVAGGLDRYAEAWRTGHRTACEATRIRGEQTEDALDQRMRCLRRRRGELDALLDVLARPDAELLAGATQVVAALTSPAACDNLDALGGAPPPSALGARVRIEALETERARALAETAALRFDAAAARLTAALAQAEQLGYKPLLAELQLELGLTAFQANHWDEAEQRLHRAVELAEEASVDRVRAVAFIHLVGIAENAGRFAEAERWAGYAQSTIERLGNDRGLLAELDLHVAEVQRARGKHKEAEGTYLRAIDRIIAAHGPRSREEALARRELAIALSAVNEHERAYQELAKSREIFVAVYGPDNPETAVSTSLMGSVRYDQQRYDEALALGREELEVLTRFFGEGHPLVAQVYQAHATKLQGVGRNDEAIEMAKRGAAMMAAHYGERHPLHAGILGTLGLLYSNLGRLDEAYAVFSRSLDIYIAVYGTEAHGDVTTTLNALGTMRRRQGRYPEAAALYERARAAISKFQQPDGRLMADVLTRIGMVDRLRGQPAAAVRALEQALASRIASQATPSLRSWTRFELALALWDTRDRPRALSLAREAESEARADSDTQQLELVSTWLSSHH